MSFIFLIIGLFMLIYYGFLAIFAGHAIGVALVWLIAGIFFIALFVSSYTKRKGIRAFRFPLFMRVFVITSAVIVIALFAYAAVLVLGDVRQDDWNAEPEFVIVPGAALNGDSADVVLQARLDAAADYWRIHPDVIIIVSGGNARENRPSEAQVMRQTLLASGVPLQNIITETRSVSTEQNLRYSLEIIGQNAREGVLIITSDFHMFRSLRLAERLTDVPVYGYPVESPRWELPYYLVYEGLALFKGWMNGYLDDAAFLPSFS
ncbi:MAG: YdcF family protein [Lachnospiraceae bacterium]|nr:YdcF family protein [Lachnospiraceae bacterium]